MLKNACSIQKALAILTLLVFSVLVVTLGFSVHAQDFPEYQKYVHTYFDLQVNWTYLEKPMFPVFLNESQVAVGQNWSVVCPLRANHSYHIYCYGKWVNNSSEPKTDYDIYVYNPLNELEGYHTESAGLPEHLGTDVKDPYFTPRETGNYTFVVENDPRESKASEQATLMLVENVDCNVWHEHYADGKDVQSLPVLNTSWAYEFVTDSQRVEVWIKVPETLDMYEARLYLMTDSKSKNYSLLNNVPLAWEPGLYGERNGPDNMVQYGGYNLESKEYRGVAYASCESYGQTMLLNFTSPNAGRNLYHLVLIGEVGSGDVDFLIKTEFESAGLTPSNAPSRAYPLNDTLIAYVSKSTDLKSATLHYSTNNWENETALDMEILENRTCTTQIPGQPASTNVSYRVRADDTFQNSLVANGTYLVKYVSSLNISLVSKTVHIGENITIQGRLTPEIEGARVMVFFESTNVNEEVACFTITNGTFTASLRPENLTIYEVRAVFAGGDTIFESSSPSLEVRVEEPTFLMKYSLYIGGAAAGAAVAGVLVYVKKFRE